MALPVLYFCFITRQHSTAMITQTTTSYAHETETGFMAKYHTFIEKAEFTRTGWAATAMMIQGCILSPALLLSMSYLGGGDWQFLASMLGFLTVLVPILGALPVKYIVPAFGFSLTLHVLIILSNLLL